MCQCVRLHVKTVALSAAAAQIGAAGLPVFSSAQRFLCSTQPNETTAVQPSPARRFPRRWAGGGGAPLPPLHAAYGPRDGVDALWHFHRYQYVRACSLACRVFVA